MIEIKDSDYFLEVLRFAVDNECHINLINKIEYLAHYGDGKNTCYVYKDWAPHSFEFVMHDSDDKRWFNGGLIYSGPGQPLDGSAPALTVGIGIDSSKHSWSVHT